MLSTNSLCVRLANVIDVLAKFAETWKHEATLGFTHFQPAQLTTVGKRATLWAYDFILDLREMERRRDELPFRGADGTRSLFALRASRAADFGDLVPYYIDYAVATLTLLQAPRLCFVEKAEKDTAPAEPGLLAALRAQRLGYGHGIARAAIVVVIGVREHGGRPIRGRSRGFGFRHARTLPVLDTFYSCCTAII